MAQRTVDRPGPDLIKLFWRSLTLLQNFKPMNDDKIGHVTILLLSDWLKIMELCYATPKKLYKIGSWLLWHRDNDPSLYRPLYDDNNPHRCQVCGAPNSSIEQRCRHVGETFRSVSPSDDKTTWASASLWVQVCWDIVGYIYSMKQGSHYLGLKIDFYLR